MRKLRQSMACALLAAGILVFQACTSDDGYEPMGNYPNALVTIKSNPSTGQVYFQLDDSTTVLPVNMKASPYGNRELRAIANLTGVKGQRGHYSQTAYINWIDTILTKKMAPDLMKENDKAYGKDPIEVVNSWMTVAEDGYLTLRFRTYSGSGCRHRLNLVKGDKPGEVVLHHQVLGYTNGVVRDGMVAFRLDDQPGNVAIEKPKERFLTLRWNSFSGVKTVRFKYIPRASSPTP